MPRRFKDKDIVKVYFRTRYANLDFIGEVLKYEDSRYYVRQIARLSWRQSMYRDDVFICKTHELTEVDSFKLSVYAKEIKTMLIDNARGFVNSDRIKWSKDEQKYVSDNWYGNNPSRLAIYVSFALKRLTDACSEFNTYLSAMKKAGKNTEDIPVSFTYEYAQESKILSLHRVFPTSEQTNIIGRTSYV